MGNGILLHGSSHYQDVSMSNKWIASRSRKDCEIQICVLGKAFVECDQFEAGRPSKRGQECVVPNLGRKGLVLCVATPERVEAVRFPGETDARIAEIVSYNCQASGIVAAASSTTFGLVTSRGKPCCVIRQKRACIARPALKPRSRTVVVMRIDGQSEPKINVRKKHLLLPESPRCARRLQVRLPGRSDGTNGNEIRFRGAGGSRCGGSGKKTVTTVPSGNFDSPSRTTTPL